MARKFEARIRQWLPHIIKCYFDYEDLNTYEIVKSTGGILRELGNAEQQVEEINTVLDFLVKAEYLIPEKSSSSYYYGINFTSTMYKTTKKFTDFIENIKVNDKNKTSEGQNDKPPVNIEIKEIKLTQKYFTFNFTLAIKKLFEAKIGLINI